MSDDLKDLTTVICESDPEYYWDENVYNNTSKEELIAEIKSLSENLWISNSVAVGLEKQLEDLKTKLIKVETNALIHKDTCEEFKKALRKIRNFISLDYLDIKNLKNDVIDVLENDLKGKFKDFKLREFL